MSFRSAAFGYLTPERRSVERRSLSSVVHLCYAKNQRFRSAAFGYLTPERRSVERRSLSSVVHLCYAKNQRFRSAAFGYLTPYGSFDKYENFTKANNVESPVRTFGWSKRKPGAFTKPIGSFS
ncbi:Uncharacterized protein XB17_03119 [Leptospira santarosai]|nr:Uncharacterized protein XB17_03119 [Leptospira santarosai]